MKQRNNACQAALDYMSESLEELEPVVSPNQSFAASTMRTDQSAFSLSHLPRISLPKFSGKFREWKAFRDQFTALIIDNRELLDVNPLQYLHSCVKGEASDAIRNLALTDANFKIAWSLLITRYENRRRLVHDHIHALHTLPQATSDSAVALTALRNKANIAIQSLKNLGRSVDAWDDILVYLLVQRLDKFTRKAWELQLGDTSEYPTYDRLDKFLLSRIRALENVLPALSQVKGNKQNSSVQSHAANASSTKCPMCQKTHFLSACPDFHNKSVAQRRDLAKKYHCCYNCLSTRHTRDACSSKNTCRQCQQKHHTLLHTTNVNNNSSTSEGSPSSTETKTDSTDEVTSHLLSHTSFSKSNILLATAWIKVSGLNGRHSIVRALLDQGSVTTLITERLAQRLRLPRTRVSVSITGIGETAATARSAAKVHVSARDGTGPAPSVSALVLKSLTTYIPQRVPDITQLPYIRELTLADNDPTSAAPIDVIIGADLYGAILLPEVRNRAPHEPVAQKSIFGWFLSGPMPMPSQSRPIRIQTHHCTVLSEISDQLKRFWEVEELPQQTHLSPEESQCEEHFVSTHSRAPNGQYIVRLPFKSGPPIDIGDSKKSAIALYSRLESRLRSNPDLAKEYHDFLAEYERLGHMTKAPLDDPPDGQVVYIPHHAVVREHSATTRLRVVFNASQPTSNGLSLNDHLMIGRKLQPELSFILLRWRQFRFVFTADIAKMYRQILVHKSDVNYQRILWRPTPNGPLIAYLLLTVTYGNANAPNVALRVVEQVAEDEGADFPLAVPVLRLHTYVDDAVFGADDIPLALQTRDQLISLLKRAGFHLRKWASNNPVLLEGIDPQDHGLASAKTLESDERLKILGIKWHPHTDVFQFDVTLAESAPDTKRSILSTIARIFYPLGWMAPVVITAKIMMQQLWLLRCKWDDVIPDDLLRKWRDYYSRLPILRQIVIPRWTGYGSDTLTAEIYGFADASASAYGAVVYLKVTHLDGTVEITLLLSKSKVAPLKPMSIPRLELLAAVLLARSIAAVRSALTIAIQIYHCWTDSKVTKAWLSQPPSRWKMFVANRVHEVQTLLPNVEWHHVPSQQNPADLVSRGVKPENLIQQSLWWTGPDWLKLSSDQWPSEPQSNLQESLPEERAHVSVHLVHPCQRWELGEKFSSWNKLVRVTAYVMRFARRARAMSCLNSVNATAKPASILLLPEEINLAREFWLKKVQQMLFPVEYAQLESLNRISNSSKLLPLNPFLDKNGLIRVGGRLRNSAFPDDKKHPVVLAAHPLVAALIRETHIRALHAGPQFTLHLLREHYWILRARQTIRAVLHKCVRCARESAKAAHELMGDLPSCRVTSTPRAFLHCGIDYAGPIQVRSTPGRGHTSRKAYIAVFVCMTVKATHLELVGDCTTPAFIAAFDRFCARRGVPSDMYSDNATTFHGAQREISVTWSEATRDSNFQSSLATQGVRWNFIPPSAPHFGGLWEACVRSVKFHMKRVIGAHTLTFEELSTLLCKIEACLNSRPIAPGSDNFDDYNSVTPSHFLIGSALTSAPTPSLLEEKETRLTRWQLITQMRDSFWKLWSNDYLHTLQQRPKWRQIQNLARVGRLVLLRNPLAPPSRWELGRIVECHPGDDGLTRVVSVKTARSTYKRAVVKLSFLPVDINTPE
ncbi:uncharacterized protein [Temnothorax nylanderi]|uniref:uncharacterized protein n=1 Tax=Temnothorax nylanderi TaxID=102681 RepID=UPI003A88434D